MKRIAESKVPKSGTNWKNSKSPEERSAAFGSQRIFIEQAHDRKGALYQGGT
ncbi:hypothetical protein WAE58_04575 [Pedobacter panaciterrae]|uniref:Uncharacterized protein n=1 Tax=Pedobacter panaciterrae TaxID=363849 RepID=A0ABU8NJK3_9SPHI